MRRQFRDYNPNQPFLFQQDIRDWLPDSHLSHFISDAVEGLDLEKIIRSYENQTGKGQPPIDPRCLLKLLIYGYSVGIRSSRGIEKASYEDVAFRILSCGQHPDHDTIASFRRRHIDEFGNIFRQVLVLCQKAGLVKVGHVSLDGTKIKGNASKSKARTYDQALKSSAELKEEIAGMLAEADAVDEAEDCKYGKGKRCDELPMKLRNRKRRLALIEELIGKMEEEAKDEKQNYEEEKEQRKKEDEKWMQDNGFKFERRAPRNLAKLKTGEIITSRRSTTDYDARIQKDHQTGGYILGYNSQAAVDGASQIILAAEVFSESNDKQLAPPMMAAVRQNTGQYPAILTADTGFWSERDAVKLEGWGIDPYIPPTSQCEGKRKIRVSISGKIQTVTEFMRAKLETKTGREIYRQRKMTVEPVFGQIKEQRQFRKFLLRGLDRVRGEWQLICMATNLRKLHLKTI